MKESMQWISGLALSFAAACSAPASEMESDVGPYGDAIPIAATAAETPSETPGTVAEETVLAEIVLSDQTYTFLEYGAGEDSTLMLRATGSVDQSNILDALRGSEGDLTMLEIFEALAPDRVPPDELVAAHPDQARALGRSDSLVRLVEKTLPPPGVDPCTGSLFFFPPLTWTNQINTAAAFDAFACVSNLAVSTDIGRGAPTSSSCKFSTTNRRMAGVCLAGSGPSITAQAGFGTATTWQLTQSTTVPRGQYLRYDVAAGSTPGRLAVLGLTGGSGAVYGMRSADGH